MKAQSLAATRARASKPVSIRFGERDTSTLRLLGVRAAAQDRSLSDQIKHYLRIAMAAEDNPELTHSMIEEIMEGLDEIDAGLGVPYEWEP